MSCQCRRLFLVFALFIFNELSAQNPANFVNPLVGTDSEHRLSHGNTYPAVAVPFGMTFWTPQTGTGRWIYQYRRPYFQGIRATHQPSPWVGDYGAFTIMPMRGTLKTKPEEWQRRFRHEQEQAMPHYYGLFIETDSIFVELTPTTRCSHLQFTFPGPETCYLVIDPFPKGTYIRVIPDSQKVVGYTRSNNGGVPDNFACYFVAKFDRPFAGFGTFDDSGLFEGSPEAGGEHTGAFVSFEFFQETTVTVKIGTSFIGLQQAEKNLWDEIGIRDFDTTLEKARQIWNDELSRITFEGATWEQLITFYTAFYRVMLYPRQWYEYDHQGQPIHFSAYDGQVHPGYMYTDNGFWDTFRAVYPFFSIMFPDRYAEMLQGWINVYREGGWFPKWPSPGYRNIMIGTHVEPLVADAYAKGIREFDVETAYQAMLKDGLQGSDFGGYGRVGLAEYKEKGFVPAGIGVKEAAARTLEFAFDDFCIAQMARALGHHEDFKLFHTRAMNYQNVFDPRTRFMRGKNSDGIWTEPFDPLAWGGPYTEGNAWHYTWSVMHDVQGLIDLMGGREAFTEKLDSLFSTPETFRIGSYRNVIHEMREMVLADMGQYAHGNQPVHHVLYLYNYAGQPWKTQKWVRRVLDQLYSPYPDGLCGDEDNGQMSAWYLFGAMGFYPVCPGHPSYVLGSPLFQKITLYLPDERVFVAEAPANSPENIYCQSIYLNGKPHRQTWISHFDIVKGGQLTYNLGPEPNKHWGTQPEDAPYSMSREVLEP